jgi:hypothetical protein
MDSALTPAPPSSPRRRCCDPSLRWAATAWRIGLTWCRLNRFTRSGSQMDRRLITVLLVQSYGHNSSVSSPERATHSPVFSATPRDSTSAPSRISGPTTSAAGPACFRSCRTWYGCEQIARCIAWCPVISVIRACACSSAFIRCSSGETHSRRRASTPSCHTSSKWVGCTMCGVACTCWYVRSSNFSRNWVATSCWARGSTKSSWSKGRQPA